MYMITVVQRVFTLFKTVVASLCRKNVPGTVFVCLFLAKLADIELDVVNYGVKKIMVI